MFDGWYNILIYISRKQNEVYFCSIVFGAGGSYCGLLFFLFCFFLRGREEGGKRRMLIKQLYSLIMC